MKETIALLKSLFDNKEIPKTAVEAALLMAVSQILVNQAYIIGKLNLLPACFPDTGDTQH